MSGEERAQAEAWIAVVATALEALSVIVPDVVDAITGEEDPTKAIEAARAVLGTMVPDLVDKWERDLDALDD